MMDGFDGEEKLTSSLPTDYDYDFPNLEKDPLSTTKTKCSDKTDRSTNEQSSVSTMQVSLAPHQTNLPPVPSQTVTSSPEETIVKYAHSIADLKAKFRDEINNISVPNLEVSIHDNLSYTCMHIFNQIRLDNLMLGYGFLQQASTEIHGDIHEDDVFIKAGTFVKLAKTYLAQNGLSEAEVGSKYFETNTYSSTLKLGVRILPAHKQGQTNVRYVFYIKLRESLYHLLTRLEEMERGEEHRRRMRQQHAKLLPTSLPVQVNTSASQRVSEYQSLLNVMTELRLQIDSLHMQLSSFKNASNQYVQRTVAILPFDSSKKRLRPEDIVYIREDNDNHAESAEVTRHAKFETESNK